MSEELTWEAGESATYTASAPISNNNIENSTLTVERVGAFDYSQNLEIILPILDKPSYEQIDIMQHYNSFDGKFSYFYQNEEVASYNSQTKEYNNTTIIDPIRKENKFNIVFDTNSGKFVKPQDINYNGKVTPQIYQTTLEDGLAVNKIKLFANRRHNDFLTNEVYDSEKFRTYIETSILNKSFISCGTKIKTPYNRDSFSNLNIDVDTYINLDPKYNFYSAEYETNFANYPEIDSTNLYTFLDALKWLEDNQNIPLVIENQNNGQYPSLQTPIFQTVPLNDKFLNKIIFSRKDYREYIKNAKKYLSTFPMTNEITISSTSEQLLLDHIFDNLDLTQLIPQNYNLASEDYSFKMNQFIYEIDENFQFDRFKEQKNIDVKIVPFFSVDSTSENQNYYNILSQLETIEDETIFGEKQNLRDFQNILDISIKEKVKEEYQKYSRNLADIYACKPCHSEILIYKISKFDINGEKIQDIYLPNISKTELSYIDTQIKYDKDYIYKISSYNMVFGECYSYVLDEEAGGLTDIDVFLKAYIVPSVLIVETPYYEEEIFVIDSPPIYPLADFYTYSNEVGKILINFSQNSGRFLEEPIGLISSEITRLSRIRKFQKKKNFEKILYKSDDFATVIELFKTDVAPKNYLNFKDYYIGTLEDITSFIDFIETNKKYYYSFRTKDIHGNISNMSPVYEVELKYYNNYGYLDVKLYNFEKEIETEHKSFKRFLYIDGNYEQTKIDFEKSGLIYIDPEGDQTEGKTAKEINNTPILGEGDSGIFGNKYFKIKIKSTNSGKVFDLLLNFNTAHIK